ncbi:MULTISPECIES: hypothetical protein [Achromobacter]|nr:MULTISPECIES: hypothetical protein [Achromobacter]
MLILRMNILLRNKNSIIVFTVTEDAMAGPDQVISFHPDSPSTKPMIS